MGDGEKRAKLFRNGGSQAVRLPKEFQFVGKEVLIRRSGNGIVLEPIGPQGSAGDAYPQEGGFSLGPNQTV